MYVHTKTCNKVHGCSIHNTREVKTTPCRQTDNQQVIFLYNGTLFSHKRSSDPYCNIEEPWQGHIVRESIYLKRSEQVSPEIQSGLVVASGWWGMGGWEWLLFNTGFFLGVCVMKMFLNRASRKVLKLCEQTESYNLKRVTFMVYELQMNIKT